MSVKSGTRPSLFSVCDDNYWEGNSSGSARGKYRDSGELTYVDAGHNAPILSSSGSTAFLEATGLPLRLFADAEYETRTAVMSRGSTLLIFSDGLTDSIQAEHPKNRLRDAFAENAGRTMSNLKSLVDPKVNQDDVAILLVERMGDSASSSVSAN